jgi:hypothetical protein
MAIYVDELRDYRDLIGRGLPGLWCHMVTDGELEELHEFAMRLGIHHHRFQDHPRHPHYDLLPASRALAVTLGAFEVTTSELARIVQQRSNGASPA